MTTPAIATHPFVHPATQEPEVKNRLLDDRFADDDERWIEQTTFEERGEWAEKYRTGA